MMIRGRKGGRGGLVNGSNLGAASKAPGEGGFRQSPTARRSYRRSLGSARFKSARFRSARSKVMALLAPLLFSAGCLRGCTSTSPPIHINPNMDDQPKVTSQAASGFFYDGAAMRQPVPNTVARGEFHEAGQEALLTGRDAQGNFISNPLRVDDQVLARGQNRFDIYCRPCHGELGDGQGVLFDYGVPVAGFKEDRIRALSDGEIFDTVTNGKGLMSGYRYPIPAQDRWAIIAYLRRLQQEEEQP